MTDDGITWSMTYNADGMRVKRTDGTTIYSYVYDGGTLLRMKKGSEHMMFAHSPDGVPLSIVYDDLLYYYVTNLQGDVVALLDAAGSEVVTYTYDAWGNILTIGGSKATTLGQDNPLRYRGYVYDQETGLYYVSSRYYDSEIGRFINADDVDLLGANGDFASYNLFAYCGNNPVVRVDRGGQFWDTVFDVISLAASVVEVCMNPTDPWAWVGLAGDAIDLIPFVTGVGEVARAAKTIDKVADVVDTTHDITKVADRVDKVVDTTKSVKRVHGNSLATTKETIGYALRKTDTGEIMKYGETTRGVKRYTKKFYRENGVYMDAMARGSKYDMHQWQHERILEYTKKYGHRPPWNKSDW